MFCKYLYKSGIKKGCFCNIKVESKNSNYCKKHLSFLKGQETKNKNLKSKLKTSKPQKSKPQKSKPVKLETPPKSNSVGTNPITNLSNLSNLLSLFDIPILDLPREEKEKEDSEETDENIIKAKEIEFNVDFNNLKTISGLISIIKLYRERPINDKSTINYDLERLCRIEKNLLNLNNMIGIMGIKNKICDMIIYLCQKRKKNKLEIENNEFLHTVLQGPPGCGKTTLARILADIYKKLGFLSNGKIVFAKRSDLVGKYCGHTAILTQQKIDEAKGGVLFIDEAYSLGNKKGDPDAFSRECIDTLNQNLSENTDFICIIAGYKEHLETRFFNINPGLARRFPWTFSIEGYSSKELEKIFKRKIEEFGFKINEDALDKKFFKLNKKYFPFYGGSILTFLNKIKICNYKRLFGKLEKMNIIIKKDIDDAFEMYKILEMGSKIEDNHPPMGMYL